MLIEERVAWLRDMIGSANPHDSKCRVLDTDTLHAILEELLQVMADQASDPVPAPTMTEEDVRVIVRDEMGKWKPFVPSPVPQRSPWDPYCKPPYGWPPQMQWGPYTTWPGHKEESER